MKTPCLVLLLLALSSSATLLSVSADYYDTIEFQYNTNGAESPPVAQLSGGYASSQQPFFYYDADESPLLGPERPYYTLASNVPVNLLTQHIHSGFNQTVLDTRWKTIGLGGGSSTDYSINDLDTALADDNEFGVSMLKLQPTGAAANGIRAYMPEVRVPIVEKQKLLVYARTPFWSNATESDWLVEFGLYLDSSSSTRIRWRSSNQAGVTNVWLAEIVVNGNIVQMLNTGILISAKGGPLGVDKAGERAKYALEIKEVGGALSVAFWRGKQEQNNDGNVDWLLRATLALPAPFLQVGETPKVGRVYAEATYTGAGAPKELWLEDVYAVLQK